MEPGNDKHRLLIETCSNSIRTCCLEKIKGNWIPMQVAQHEDYAIITLPEVIETMDRYDDPEINDMEEVWVI